MRSFKSNETFIRRKVVQSSSETNTVSQVDRSVPQGLVLCLRVTEKGTGNVHVCVSRAQQ